MKKALVLSLALVLGVGLFAFAQGEISGEWATTITIDPTALTIADFFDFSTTLDVTYSIGGWDFTSHTVVDDGGWKSQSFDADGDFGAFGIESTMVFGVGGSFTSWAVDTDFTFGSVTLAFDFDLLPGDLTLGVSGTATTGLVDITIDMLFGATGGGCDLDWQGVDIYVDFPFCCADVSATLNIGCLGFEKICFDVVGIEIPNLPWVTVDAELCFELESKTLVLSPNFDFGADVCFDLYICELNDGGLGPLTPLHLGDFYIAGIGLECEIGGISFEGISFWGTQCTSLKPADLGSYWEMYRISTTETACCGDFDFDVAVFFDVASTYLFDVAAFEANFSYELGDNFTFSMGLDYTAAAGLTLWSIGFDITW
jgi:hypothetical protein